MPATHFVANASAAAVSRSIEPIRLRAITGIITLSSKLPCIAGDRDRRVVADHLRADLQHRLGDHRVDLARHDRRTLLQLGQHDLAETRPRPARHPAQVVADLGQRDGDRLQRPGRGDERVTRGLGGEVIGGCRDEGCHAGRGPFAEPAADPFGELRVRVQPVAHRGATERDPAELGQRRGRPGPPRSEPARRTRRTPDRASRARRPSGACDRTSRRRRTRPPSIRALRRARSSAGTRSSCAACNAARWTADGNTSFEL